MEIHHLENVMARCEDWPCCGHEAGCCPDFDESGRQLNMKCTCGATVPLGSRYSICEDCLLRGDPDDPESMMDRGDLDDLDDENDDDEFGDPRDDFDYDPREDYRDFDLGEY